jgi:hypothetical protein
MAGSNCPLLFAKFVIHYERHGARPPVSWQGNRLGRLPVRQPVAVELGHGDQRGAQRNPAGDFGFFPEATSSDGTQVLPFRSAFFEVAAGTNLKIQPLALRWSDPRAAWHGDMTFGPHLRTVLGLRNLMLEVHALEPIAVQAHDTRKDLCAQAERAIVDAMGITSTIC